METLLLFLVSLIVVYLGVTGWVSNAFEPFARQNEEGTPPNFIPKQALLAWMVIFILLCCLIPKGQTSQKRQTRLLEILDDGGKQCCADIVAVHGLASTAETTWNYKMREGHNVTMGPMWLRDFLPQENLHARIMVFNHNSAWERNATTKTLEDHGNDLLRVLDEARSTPETHGRPIIFIGHSFGGIVIKQALHNALTDSLDLTHDLSSSSKKDDWKRKIAQNAKGFIFLGTPHKGASLTWLGRVIAMLNFWRGSSSALLQAIQPGSCEIQRIHDQFNQTFPVKETVVCFFEAELTRILGMPLLQVVSKDSARIENADSFGFESNHQNLQRFQSRADDDYLAMVHYLRKYIEKAARTAQVIQERAVEEPNTAPRGRGPKNQYFFGRDAIIENLHRQIKPEPHGAQHKMKVCVLHGLGGAGKTQIATEYTYRHGMSYKYMFWVRAEVQAEAERGFTSIASQLSDGLEDQRNQQRSIEVARARLKTSKEPWLLIFDNVVSIEDVEGYIPEGTAGSIIITTQSTKVKDRWPSRIWVKPFEEWEGANLLLKYFNQKEREEENGVPDSIEDARKISTLVGGLPLAIAVIAGYISSVKMTLRLFMSEFDQKPKVLTGWDQSDGPFVPGYDKPLNALFDMALDDLKPEARDLLDCFSFMNPDDIQENMIFREHAESSLEFLSTTNPRLGDLKQDLYGRHLTEKKPPSHPQESGSFSIHRYVKHHIQAKLLENPQRHDKAFRRALFLVRAVFPRQHAGSSPTNQKWPLYDKYYLHVLSLHAAYKEALKYSQSQNLVNHAPVEFGTLLSDLGNYMYERYLIQSAFNILDTADEVLSKVLGSDQINPEKLQVLYLRASIELNHGITKRAAGVAHKEELVRLRLARLAQLYRHENRAVHETASRQLSTAYNNLACAYMHCDDYERAMPLFKKSRMIKKKWWKQSMSPQLPAFSEINKNLALVYLSRGDGDAALSHANEAVRLVDQWINGGPGSKVGQFMRYMRACVLFNIGNKQGALIENLMILKARFDILGETHDHTIDSYFAVGMINFTLGDWYKAEVSLRKCLELRNEYYETRLPRVLCCLGRVLAHLNQHEESEKYLREARELFQRLLPKIAPEIDFSDPDDMVRYDQIANLWSGRFTGKLNLEWQKAQSNSSFPLVERSSW